LRVLAPALVFSILAFAGQDSYASGLLEACHPNREAAERHRDEKETQFYTGHSERNTTIQAWLKIATRQDISNIWGAPVINKDILRWEIPSESSQFVSSKVDEMNGSYCFLIGFSQFSFIVQEPFMKTSETERTITRIIKLGSSTFKRENKL